MTKIQGFTYDQQLSNLIARGWRITLDNETLTVLVPPPQSHVLHLILTVITVGLWLPIWLLIAMFGNTNPVTLYKEPTA